MRSIFGAAVAGVALSAAALGAPPVQAQPANQAARTLPVPLTLDLPGKVFGYTYGSGSETETYLELTASLRATGGVFEVRGKRTSYDKPVAVTWKAPTGEVKLPAWTLKHWGGLNKFLSLQITNAKGRVVATDEVTTCLNGFGQRTKPEAPARSPYPQYGCPTNPFTRGTVMGIQDGWASTVGIEPTRRLRLAPGRYTLKAEISPRYRSLLGLPASSSTDTTKLVVQNESDERRSRAHTPAKLPQAAHKAPSGAQLKNVDGPRPDLRSLPAWGMQVSENGNYLEFAATVWNAGTSPLVVDGFRRKNEPLMDAYQYFFDKDLNQVGYQKIGTMEWDARPSHQHWHFEDFARYRLLTADLKQARRSQKEAFCLANTDAVDYTVSGADWNPDGTDLETACGELDSLSVREVLSSGSGDTYSQIRAGQSFNLRGLANGTYYISVEANPFNRLVELDATNNVALRKVVIGGKTGARTVKSFPVGLVDDSGYSIDY
ncbi:MAG: lysyl oxidase family protein [Marmoricola sp.]